MELLPWLAKSTLLLALAFAAVVVLRKGSADLRHLVWRGVFAALLLLPLTVQLAPEWIPRRCRASRMARSPASWAYPFV